MLSFHACSIFNASHIYNLVMDWHRSFPPILGNPQIILDKELLVGQSVTFSLWIQTYSMKSDLDPTYILVSLDFSCHTTQLVKLSKA